MRLSLLWMLLVAYLLEIDEVISKANCPKPSLENGRAKVKSQGRMVRYRCKKKFKLYGAKMAICISDKWNQPAPVCAGTRCPAIVSTSPDLIITKALGGSVLKFSCTPGLIVKGVEEIYCTKKTWNDTLPSCIYQEPDISCDFEKQDLCGWTQDKTDTNDFDWTRHSGKTRTTNTGPDRDHTYPKADFGHYMFIEVSRPRRKGHFARLLSPFYRPVSDGYCFDFYYHMKGPNGNGRVGSLEVFVRGGNQTLDDVKDSPYFFKSGNQGDEWQRGRIVLGEQKTVFQIVIVGTRNTSYVSDISIDDVRLYNCSEDGEFQTTEEQLTTELSTTEIPTSFVTSAVIKMDQISTQVQTEETTAVENFSTRQTKNHSTYSSSNMSQKITSVEVIPVSSKTVIHNTTTLAFPTTSGVPAQTTEESFSVPNQKSEISSTFEVIPDISTDSTAESVSSTTPPPTATRAEPRITKLNANTSMESQATTVLYSAFTKQTDSNKNQSTATDSPTVPTTAMQLNTTKFSSTVLTTGSTANKSMESSIISTGSQKTESTTQLDMTSSKTVTTLAQSTSKPAEVSQTASPKTKSTTTMPSTTVSPTTMSSTTVSPTTMSSTTVSPTTMSSTTVSPTTMSSTTVSPTTMSSTTMSSTTGLMTKLSFSTENITTARKTTGLSTTKIILSTTTKVTVSKIPSTERPTSIFSKSIHLQTSANTKRPSSSTAPNKTDSTSTIRTTRSENEIDVNPTVKVKTSNTSDVGSSNNNASTTELPNVIVVGNQNADPEVLFEPLMIGLGVGVAIGLIIVLAGLFFWIRRKRRKEAEFEDEMTPITKSSSHEW